MDNEVVIHVRVKNEGKLGFEAVGREADEQARKTSLSFSERFAQTLRTNLSTRLAGALTNSGGPADTVGQTLGDRISQRMSDRITERITRDSSGRWRDAVTGRFVSGGDGGRGGEGGKGGDAKVSVDVDKQSLFQRMMNAGREGATKFTEGFQSLAGNLFSGDVLSTIIKGISITALAALLAPVLGAAITAAFGIIAGGGLIAVGIAAAFQDKRIMTSAKNVKEQILTMFSDFGQNFKGPIQQFLVGGDANGGGGLIGVLHQLAPQLSHLGEVLGPVAANIGQGIIGFLQNAMPGLLRMIEKSAPILNVLANELPDLGDAMGRFFDHIGNGAPGAAQFLSDFLGGIELLIRLLGTVIEWLTQLYAGARIVFLGMMILLGGVLEAAAAAFGWIPGLGPKIERARDKFADFFHKLSEDTANVDTDITINIRFRVLSMAAATAALKTARLLSNMGYAHGGVVGAATGGLHSGLRMVGEHGPELLELPAGTRVNSNPDTERILAGAGGGGGQPILVQLLLDGKVLAQQMVEPTRELVSRFGRGSVQTLYGRAGVA